MPSAAKLFAPIRHPRRSHFPSTSKLLQSTTHPSEFPGASHPPSPAPASKLAELALAPNKSSYPAGGLSPRLFEGGERRASSERKESMEKGRGREGEPLGRGGASVRRNRSATERRRTTAQRNELAVLRGEGMKVGVRGAGSICVKRGESSRRRDSALFGENGQRRRRGE